ncbi:MAG: ABC transporter permease [Bacilli bacterium]|nr:ABC transporter permease [Bacilli bacterium]
MKKKFLSSLLLKLGLKETKNNWAQGLAIMAITGIAMTLLIGFFANSNSLETRLNKLISDTNYASMYVTTDPTKPQKDDYELIERHLDPTADKVEGRFYFYCNLNSKSSLGAVYNTFPTISTPYRMLEQIPEQTDTDFFIVDKVIATNGATLYAGDIKAGEKIELSIDLSSYKIGDKYISFLDSYLLPGKQNPLKSQQIPIEMTITGIMEHPENAAKASLLPSVFLLSNKLFRDSIRDTLAKSFTETGIRLIWSLGFYGIMGWGDGDSYGDTEYFPSPNQYLIKLADYNKVYKLENELEAEYAKKSVNNLYRIQNGEQTQAIASIRDDVRQAVSLTWVFPIVFFAVALLVIIASTRQLILRQRQQIGVFKAIGLTNREIYSHFMLQTGGIVALGILAGLIIGPILLPKLLSAKYDLLYVLPTRTYSFPIFPILMAVLVFLGLTLGIAYLVTRREVKLKPAEALRPAEIKIRALAKKNSKEKKKPKFLPLSMAMVRRNLIQDPIRSIMVIIGVLGCTALLCCGFGIEDTLNYSIDTDPFINSGADVSLYFANEVNSERIQQDVSVKDEQGNELIYGYQTYYRANVDLNCGDNSYSTYFNAIGDYSCIGEGTKKNHFPYKIPSGEALISEKVARRLGVRIGSEVTFYLNNTYIAVKIGGMFPAFYDNGLFVNNEADILKDQVGKISALWVDANNRADDIKIAEDLGKLSYVAVSDTATVWRKKINDTVSSIWVLTNAIKVFAILLAIVVLYNLGLLNFRERIREIATLKVLGFKAVEISISLLVEVLSLVLIGVIGGLFTGFPFMKLLLIVNEVEKVDYLYKMNLSTYFLAFALTFVLSVVVNIILMFRIRKIQAVESLKSVE